MESNQKIFNKIDELYNIVDESGKQKNKTFFSHLMKAYLPLNSVGVAIEKPKSNKIRVRCVFTKKDLITLEQAKETVDTESMRKSMENFAITLDTERGCFLSSTPMKQLFGSKVLAIQGKGTETYMSQESYATFINWIMMKYIEGDKHIKWVLHQIKGKLHPGIKIKTSKPNKAQKSTQVYATGSKKATLGDLSALQALKDKLK